VNHLEGGAHSSPQPLVIIVEGPDGAGKTTLAKRLAQDLDLEYHHEGPPPQGVASLTHYTRLLGDAKGKRVIFDRFALGERVYGPILRGHDSLGEEGWQFMVGAFAAMRARHIVCLPPPMTAHGNWCGRKDEMFRDPLAFFHSYASFSYLASRYNLRTHDFTVESYVNVLKYVKEV
jgi:hypothetical protein